MAIFSFLDPVLNFMFGWLLNFSPFWAVLVLSFAISLLIVLVYKYTTNQTLMKSLKEEIKSLQKSMRELRQEPEKMVEVNKKAMEANLKYMTHSFKPMLFTFLPIIVIFGWMNSSLAFEPIGQQQEFTMTALFEKGATGNITVHAPAGLSIVGASTKELSDGKSIFTFKGLEGLYGVAFEFREKQYVKEVLIGKERKYIDPVLPVNEGGIKSITTDHEKTKVIKIGSFWLSWLWSYILFSIVFSLGLRKLLKVY